MRVFKHPFFKVFTLALVHNLIQAQSIEKIKHKLCYDIPFSKGFTMEDFKSFMRSKSDIFSPDSSFLYSGKVAKKDSTTLDQDGKRIAIYTYYYHTTFIDKHFHSKMKIECTVWSQNNYSGVQRMLLRISPDNDPGIVKARIIFSKLCKAAQLRKYKKQSGRFHELEKHVWKEYKENGTTFSVIRIYRTNYLVLEHL